MELAREEAEALANSFCRISWCECCSDRKVGYVGAYSAMEESAYTGKILAERGAPFNDQMGFLRAVEDVV